MPAFGLPNYAQGIVFVPVAATGAAAAYTAKANDVVICEGGATGPAVTITLPTIVGLLPLVAEQPPVGASGPFFPQGNNADDVKVIVRTIAAATGAAYPKVITTDGSLINGASGASGLSTVAANSGYTFVSKGGNWYTV